MNEERKNNSEMEYEPVPSFEDDPNFSALLGIHNKTVNSSVERQTIDPSEEDEFAATKRMDLNEKLPHDLSVDQIGSHDTLRVQSSFMSEKAEHTMLEQSDKKRPKKKKKKMSRTVSTLIWLGSVIAVAVFIAVMVIVVARDVYGMGKGTQSDPREIELYIDPGDTLYDVVEMLSEEGIIQSKLVFKAFVKFTKVDTTIQYGMHVFDDTMGYGEILATLREQTAFKDVVNVTIPEGSNLDEIAALLQEKGVIEKASAFKDALIDRVVTSTLIASAPQDRNIHYAFEGYLFADTYQFYLNSTPAMAAQKMLDRLEEVYTEQMRKDTWSMGWSCHQVLTLASIVEKETNGCTLEQKQKVAAVFINRLNWVGEPRYLGSTPTITYANKYGEQYNTNTDGGYEGLPPGPICSPSENSIRAVIYATDNFDYYYFVTDSNGKFYFSRTYREHQNIIASLKRQGLWS